MTSVTTNKLHNTSKISLNSSNSFSISSKKSQNTNGRQVSSDSNNAPLIGMTIELNNNTNNTDISTIKSVGFNDTLSDIREYEINAEALPCDITVQSSQKCEAFYCFKVL